MTSKVLKVLKVLNFSGDGEGNTFTCTFTGAAAPWLGAKRPSPQHHHATPKGHPAPGLVRRATGICCGDNGFRHVYAEVRMI